MPTEYHDPDIGDGFGEWVAISKIGTGRKFYAIKRADAEKARDDDDKVWQRHHRDGIASWVYNPDQEGR